MPSSAPTGRIEVSSRSPGTTSTIHAPAAARACWPTPPSATIMPSPIVSAPSVSAVRLGSRMTELVPAAPPTATPGERQPAEPREAGSSERDQQGPAEDDRVHDQRLDGARRAGGAR